MLVLYRPYMQADSVNESIKIVDIHFLLGDGWHTSALSPPAPSQFY